MAPPAIHLCVRQTLDWKDRALVEARIIPAFRPKLEMWNATLRPPYHELRQRLKEIAELSLSRVEGATLSEIAAVPPGELIVPTDDDDWFAPDLVVKLRAAHDPAARGYLWTRDVIEPPPRLRTGLGWLWAKAFGPPRDPWICKTNNYAFRSDLPDIARLLAKHTVASRFVEENPAAVKRLPDTLAIQNRNVASQTALKIPSPTISRAELLAVVRRYRDVYTSWRPRDEVRWAAPYVRLMAELMAEVGPR